MNRNDERENQGEAKRKCDKGSERGKKQVQKRVLLTTERVLRVCDVFCAERNITTKTKKQKEKKKATTPTNEKLMTNFFQPKFLLAKKNRQ